MSRFLVRAGASCVVVSTDLGLTTERRRGLADVEVVALPCVSRRFYLPKFSYKDLRKLVEGTEVVHLMGHWTFLNALMYVITRRVRRPYVVCPAGALEIYGRSRYLKRLYNSLVGKRIIRNADAYVAITVGEIPQFESYGIDADRVTVIPNGIELWPDDQGNTTEFREKHRIGGRPFVLFMGRLNRIKGPDLLLEAFLGVADQIEHDLVIAGPDDGMLPELRRQISQAGVEDRVHIVGHLAGADKISAYLACELLVVPSRREAMSIVALEAGVASKPVLLTDRCGFDEVDAVGGGRVVPASIDGLRQGLLSMLRDTDELLRMGTNLHKFTVEHFIWGTIARRYLSLYDKLLHGVA